jgi:anhydro-N-acetylmuramic acid kinase
VRVAGLISGTSADGIDVAVVDINERIEVVTTKTIPYPPEVRSAILSVLDVAAISRLNFLLGELFAEALGQCGVPLDTIELIGSHGQTIFHEGEPVVFLGRKIASTLQIGEASVIAARTGIETIADFRPSDIAAGGKGAPLVPFLDYQLFRHSEIPRIALNIGGIANITVIPAGAKPEDVVAFDTGPGNMLIDAVAPPFDRDGARARAGQVNEALLSRLLSDPYYSRNPPKSCGREQYGADFGRRSPQHIHDGTSERVAPAPPHDFRGIRHRRGLERGHPVRGSRLSDVPAARGQPAVGDGRPKTGDFRQDFAATLMEQTWRQPRNSK